MPAHCFAQLRQQCTAGGQRALIGRTARWIKAFEDKSLPAYKALRPDLIAAPASSPVATGGAAAPADAASSGTQR